MILEQIVALDVADEIQIELFAEPEGFQRQFVALGVLGADAQDAHARILALQNFARINAAHDGKLREVKRLAFDVGAGVQQDKFVVLRGASPWRCSRGPRRECGPTLKVPAAKMPPVLPRETSASALPSLTSSAARAMEESFFLRSATTGLSSISTTSRGVDDADAMVAKTARRQRGVDFVLVADEIDGGDVLVFLQGALHAGDDDTAAVVAAHDIHCDSHGQPVTRPR